MDDKSITGIDLLKHVNFDDDFDSTLSKIFNLPHWPDFIQPTQLSIISDSEIKISKYKSYISLGSIKIFNIPAEMVMYFRDHQKLSYIDFEIDALKTALLNGVVSISTRDGLWEYICKLVDDTYFKLKDKYPSLDISKEEHSFSIKCEDCVIEMGGETRDKERCIVSIREKRQQNAKD